MKITISLEQLNEFAKLPRTEQQVVINHLNALSKMSETEIQTAPTPSETDTPALAERIQRLAVKRAKDARRRREQRSRRQQQQQTVETAGTLKFEGAVKHEVKMFETRFKDDFHQLISRHLRQLRKSLQSETPQLRDSVIGYAHSYMHHTFLTNIPAKSLQHRL